mmetsp:Transcript_124615/g.311677  ORF Transcript_124615/g.311677 Transcript_124615/m.311677 type:complete len:214 (-) Transcript_124615:699-1340(-)
MKDLLSDFCTVCKQKHSSVKVRSPYLSRKGMVDSPPPPSAVITLLMIASMSFRCPGVQVNTDCQFINTVLASFTVAGADFGRSMPILIAAIMHLNTDSASLFNLRALTVPTSVVSGASSTCFTRAFKLSRDRFHSDITFSHSSCFFATMSLSWGSIPCALPPNVSCCMARSCECVSFTAFSSLITSPLPIAAWSFSRQAVTTEALEQMKFISC